MPFKKGGPRPKRKKTSWQPREAKRNQQNRQSTHLVRQIREARPSQERSDVSVTAHIALEAQRETDHEEERAALVLSSRSAIATIVGEPILESEIFEDANSDDESIVDNSTDLGPVDDPFFEYAVASSDENKRITIAYHFEKTLNCPPEEEWGGRDGTITKICGIFDNNTASFRKTVKKVFSAVLKCQNEKIASGRY